MAMNPPRSSAEGGAQRRADLSGCAFGMEWGKAWDERTGGFRGPSRGFCKALRGDVPSGHLTKPASHDGLKGSESPTIA